MRVEYVNQLVCWIIRTEIQPITDQIFLKKSNVYWLVLNFGVCN